VHRDIWLSFPLLYRANDLAKIFRDLINAISHVLSKIVAEGAKRLLRLLCLGAEIGGSGGMSEVAGKDWLKKGAEDNLSATRIHL
jgi:hypothetical protein